MDGNVAFRQYVNQDSIVQGAIRLVNRCCIIVAAQTCQPPASSKAQPQLTYMHGPCHNLDDRRILRPDRADLHSNHFGCALEGPVSGNVALACCPYSAT